MSEWQPISTAPKDGTRIRARIRGLSTAARAEIAWREGFLNGDGEDCGGWVWMLYLDRAPASWTDGVCWESNDSGKRSTQPYEWQPLPDPPAATISHGGPRRIGEG